MSSHTPTPWVHRPRKYDDWGLICGADGIPVATAGVSSRYPKGEWPFDPEQGCFPEPPEIAANAALIVRAVNSHVALVAFAEQMAFILGTMPAPALGDWNWPQLAEQGAAALVAAKGDQP